MAETYTITDEWLILDEQQKRVFTVKATTREAAIKAFCHPGLRKDAYFGPNGCGWTCVPSTNYRSIKWIP